jgi:hypothetical protein
MRSVIRLAAYLLILPAAIGPTIVDVISGWTGKVSAWTPTRSDEVVFMALTAIFMMLATQEDD